MLTAYQHLLRLYPKTYRKQFGDEMFAVFEDVRSEINHKGALARIAFFIREIAGLINGALREHLRTVFGVHQGFSIPTRRFTVRNEFRFPKSTAVLMMIILAGIVLAFVNPWISIALYLLVAVMWLIPDRRIENALRDH